MKPLELSEVTLQIVVSPTIIILTTLEVSFMVLEHIYSTGVTHDDRHLLSSYFYSTGHKPEWSVNLLNLLKTCIRKDCFQVKSKFITDHQVPKHMNITILN
jgi:hypothetical protein